MKYNQPYDQPANPDAPYVNANSSLRTPGSIVPAEAVEYPQREVVRTIADIGLATPTNDDLSQLSQAVRMMRAQFLNDVSSVVNSIVLPFNPAPSVWKTPLSFFVSIARTNTSPTVTCSILGVSGTRNVIKRDGAPVAIGDLVAGSILFMTYDGTNVRCATLLNSDLPVYTVPGTPTWTFNVQVLTALSGTYTKTIGATRAVVLATGGGGAGGSAKASPPWGIGTGGESGMTSIAFVNLIGVTSIPYTIGLGGTPTPGSSAPAATTQAPPGGDTQFGAGGTIYALAKGGKSGFNSVILGGAVGGTTGGVGMIILPGKAGEGAVSVVDTDPGGPWANGTMGAGLRGGNGGSSIWGGPGYSVDANVTGVPGATAINGHPATGWGSGGAGGDTGTFAPADGGAGKQGIIVVIEFGLT